MKTKGVLYGSFAAVLWGTVFVFGRLVLKNGEIHPVVLAFFRFVFASFFLLTILALQGKIKKVALIKDDFFRFFLLGLTGIYGMSIFIFSSLKRTLATNSSVLMNSNPIFVLLFASLFLKEKLTFLKFSGVAIGFLGCYFIVNNGFSNFSVFRNEYLSGNFLALLAAVCWALYTALGKEPSRKYGALITTLNALLIGTILLFLTILILKIPFHFTARAFLVGVYLGLIPAGLGYVFWFRGLKYVKAGSLAPLQYLAPVVTMIIACFWLKERITLAVIVGAVLIFLGFFLPLIKERKCLN